MVARAAIGSRDAISPNTGCAERIIAAANAHGRPVVTATPCSNRCGARTIRTRAEATDVANAVLDRTDAVMLSAETAIGQFPIAAVRFLARVLTATEKGYSLRMAHDRMRATDMPGSLPDMASSPDNALSFAACQLAARLSARAIIVPAHTMAAALAIARFRPQAPLVVVASSMRLYRSLALVRGVSPLLSAAASDTGTGTGTGPQACLVHAREWLVSQGLAEPGDQVVLVFASSSACERADSLRTIRLSPDGGTG